MVIFVALIFKKEPSEVADVVRAGLKKMEDKRAFSTPRLAKTTEIGDIPELAQKIPVYNLGLKDLAEDRGLDAASHIGWRYLLGHDSEVIASADAYFFQEKKPTFAQINEGPMVNGIVSGIQAAETEKDIEKGNYEVRLLMVPALYVASIWLVDMVGDKDKIIPIAPTLIGFKINEPLSVNEFFEVLQKAAKEALSSQLSE
jgi:hypothetical protein